MWYLTPGKSFTRPPLIKTTECSCKLWPSPGIYAETSIPLDNLTLATFLKAEFGFLGVWVKTLTQTPLLNGEKYLVGLFFRVLKPDCSATVLLYFLTFF